MIVSIDPGIRDTAAARFKNSGELVSVRLFHNDSVRHLKESMRFFAGRAVEVCLIEDQWAGAARLDRKDIGLLKDLCYWSGVAACSVPCERVDRIAPVVWKRSTKKEKMCMHIAGRLFEEEVEMVREETKKFSPRVSYSMHLQNIKQNRISSVATKRVTDLLDAIGIGFYHVGRL